MKVYHIGTRGIPTTQGGIERHIEEIATRLADRVDITVYARSYYVPPMKEYRGVSIRRLRTVKTKHLDTILYAMLATFDVLFRPRGIVHYHALGPSVFAWLPRLFGHKTVVTVHGLDWQRAKWGWIARKYLQACEQFSVRFPQHTIVVSQVLREYYIEQFGTKFPERCYLLIDGRIPVNSELDHVMNDSNPGLNRSRCGTGIGNRASV